MNTPKHTNSGFDYFFKFQKSVAARIVWPYSFEKDSLYRERAFILSSILIAGLLFGFFAIISATVLIIKENAWGLAIVDFMGLMIGLLFLFIHRIKFEIRASISLLMFYVIGLAIILSIGPLSGGPAWLFAFAVLAGVLMGNYAAFAAILMNAIFLSVIGIMISTGKFGNEFPFFNSPQAMIAAGVNFIVLNAITAVSVSALVRGLLYTYKKKEDLANRLEEEKAQLIETKQFLESEIKDRKQAEETLRKERDKAKKYLDIAGVIIVVLNADQTVAMINKKGCEILDYEESEVIGKKWFDNFLSERDKERTKAGFSELIAGNIEPIKYFENHVLTKNNDERLIAWHNSVFRNSKGKIIATLSSGEDITERIWAEEMLRDSEEKYRTILESIEDGYYEVDMKGNFTFLNDSMCKILGYSKDELTGLNNRRYMDEENAKKIFKTFNRVYKTGQPYKAIDWELIRKDGSRCYVETSVALKRNSKGQPIGFQGIARDISERKKVEKETILLEKRLRQSQKMESIGTLAGGIAHDFNNVLFPIVGYTEMLLEDVPEDSPFRASLKNIYTSALRAKNLVKQILTFSRQDSNELTLMKMQPIVKEALKLIRSTIPTTIEIKQDINPDCGVIKADPTQIHQIVMNLTTNAYHAMEETGGELKVSLKEVELGEYDIINTDMIPGIYVCLIVADTGVGMDKSLTDKIFDPFFTTKAIGKGTGMGLSVVHGIVTAMGGAIQVYSEPGKGTQFHVYLPVEKSLSEIQVIHSTVPIQGGTEQILLVDDEEAILSMEKRMLERLGYQVTSHSSSFEALEAFRDSPDKFDLVITDMAMPNMPGDKLSVELTKICPGIPILLCTGFSETMSEEKAASIGIKGFLMKPIVMMDLAQKIREVLNEN
ncbi:MAG: PAS domain S-box protein [Deltaproteobacteria bacterium]|uniref:PAS domain S-box protein n=1 Tax=Desulfobacula sp. TaxID=2593537 RepID=UPI0019C6D731|nr:PAS domain S-box protein [Candidatus Desulfobacula maris]MBL6993302.1 PAS domain S-box protein [Desulfobacula sp.]